MSTEFPSGNCILLMNSMEHREGFAGTSSVISSSEQRNAYSTKVHSLQRSFFLTNFNESDTKQSCGIL